MIQVQMTPTQAEALYDLIVASKNYVGVSEEDDLFLTELQDFLFAETEKALGRV
jgi:hypothetical protein